MTTATVQRTFVRRIGYLTTCVIPAALLSDEPTEVEDISSLRADASRGGLSFAHITQSLEEGVYLARVAASPDRVAHGYTVLLTEHDLHFALPWDHRVEWEDRAHDKKRCPAAILAMLRAHAAEVQPLTKRPPVPEPEPMAAASLTPLDSVEVSTQDIQDAFAQAMKQGKNETEMAFASRRTNQFHLQQALLQTMIDTLMTQLYQAQEHAYALTLKARCALIAQLQRWHRCTQQERIVNAVPKFSQDRQQVIWRLTVGLPAVA